MAKHLNRLVGELTYDKLIASMTPPVKVASGTIEKLSSDVTYKRGCVLCRSGGTGGNGKLKLLGTSAASEEVLTPDCILCDDEEMGSAADVNAAVYVSGCFNPDSLIVKDGYSMSQDDIDKLRERGLYLSQIFD